MWSHRALPTLALPALLCLATAAARGDVVHLAGGGQVEGRVTREGDRVRVEVPGGTLVFPASRVVRIEARDPPQVRLRAALDRLEPGDRVRALELAREADAAGLPELGDEVLATAARRAPGDAQLQDAVRRRRVLRDSLPDGAGAAERLVRDLGAGARLLRTNHYLVAHDLDPAAARRRAELLEAAWRKFHELAHALQLSPARLDARLEVLLFAEHDRWLAATGLPAERLRGMSGIFHARTGRVLLYDPSQSPEAREAGERLRDEMDALAAAVRELEGQERELDVLRTRLGALQARSQRQVERRDRLRAYVRETEEVLAQHRRRLDERREELARHERVLHGWEDRESLASTTHEACHQLAYATGIGRAGEPRWLTEGLATLFELDTRESFVLEAPNAGRLRDVRAAWDEGHGGDLRRLVDGTLFDDPETPASLAYAEAWSLAHYLARRHTAAFARYVQEAALLPGLAAASTRRIEEFEHFFGGDIEALERDWLRTIRRL